MSTKAHCGSKRRLRSRPAMGHRDAPEPAGATALARLRTRAGLPHRLDLQAQRWPLYSVRKLLHANAATTDRLQPMPSRFCPCPGRGNRRSRSTFYRSYFWVELPSSFWPENVRLIAESEFNGNLIRKRREAASSRDYADDLPPAG